MAGRLHYVLTTTDLPRLWAIDDVAERERILRASLARVGIRPLLVTMLLAGLALGAGKVVLQAWGVPTWGQYVWIAAGSLISVDSLHRWERRRAIRELGAILRSLGRCSTCGYRLSTPEPSRCPECGTLED